MLRPIRRSLGAQLFDESPGAAAGVAIYSLSDPRDIRAIRYVGQSVAPRRRLLQHLIHECLEKQLPLLNAGTELLRRQRLLI